MKYALRKTAYLRNQTTQARPSELRRINKTHSVFDGTSKSLQNTCWCLTPIKVFLYVGHSEAPDPSR